MCVLGYPCGCREDDLGRSEIRDREITEFLNRIYKQEKRGRGLEHLGWNPIKFVSDIVGVQVSWSGDWVGGGDPHRNQKAKRSRPGERK